MADEPLSQMRNIHNKYTRDIRILSAISTLFLALGITYLYFGQSMPAAIMIPAALSLAGLAAWAYINRRRIENHLRLWGYSHILDENSR